MSQPDEPLVNRKRAVVGRSLRCRSCGYDLRGLRLEAQCPECGLAVHATVDDAIDPAKALLPALRNPRHLGYSLVWLTFCIVACAVMLALPPAMAALREVEGWRQSPFLALGPRELLLAAAGIALLGLRSAWVFTSIQDVGSDAIRMRREGRMIAAGLLIIAISAVSAWAVEQAGPDLARSEARQAADLLWLRLGFAVGGGLLFVGLGRILEILGRRSRVYREARGGRQSTHVMAAALCFIALGTLAQLAGILRRLPQVQWVGEVVVLACAVMVIIGSAYLVVNAWWVRTALRTPGTRMRDLVRIEPDTTWTSPRGSRNDAGKPKLD